MKRVLAIIFLVVIVLGAWYLFIKEDPVTTETDTKVEALKVKKHSDEFNNKVDNMINSYLEMKTAFVNSDTNAIKSATTQFIATVDSVPLSQLKNDDQLISTAATQQVSELKANAEPILQETELTAMRHDFSMVSENLYPFLKTIGYEGEKLYWQNCPMAFGDDKPANWLSSTSEIINPYMGKNHPEFKSSMLHCGENMDSLYAK
jgi:hypothetical protein